MHHKKEVRIEVCKLLLRISAGNKFQVDAILESEGMLKSLLNLFETDDGCIKIWICEIFSNLAHLS
jgi:hypothetical protein